MKQKMLFICTHNSARSQMAEGLMNHFLGDRYEAFSAGTEQTMVNPFAVEAMKELGIDTSPHRSKTVEEFRGSSFDCVVTVCDSARESYPFFLGKRTGTAQEFRRSLTGKWKQGRDFTEVHRGT